MFKKFLGSFIYVLCTFIILSADPVKTSPSRKIVSLNESFSVVFSTHERVSAKPDFTALQTDFEILSTSQGQSTQIMNGQVNQEMSWTLTLMPKHLGKLTIPAINFGQSQSLPVSIEVTSATTTDNNDSPLFLETELDPKSAVFEQTQLIYTVRLYRTVNLAQASLSDIKVSDPDAVIERLGKDTEYEHYQPNGQRYAVLERKYALFPQKAGELIVSPTVFEGSIVEGNGFFFGLHNAQFKRLTSDEEKVMVNPIPAPFTKKDWLPAHDVALSGEWSADPSKAAVGEPLTWTLTLTADGCLGTLLPDISPVLPGDLRHYADKPQVTNQQKENGFVGGKQLKMVLIPAKPGELIIPEVSVKWWDLKSNQARIAKIPSTVLQVGEGAVAMSNPPVPQATSTPALEPQEIPTSLPTWAWGLIGLNAFWITGLVFILFKQVKRDPIKLLKSHFKNACAASDAKQAELALIAWGSHLFPHEQPLNLLKLKKHVPAAFQVALDELYESLYGKKIKWSGENLWKAFLAFNPRKASHKPKKAVILRELYPE